MEAKEAFHASTIGELEAALLGHTSDAASRASEHVKPRTSQPSIPAGLPASMQCGIDIETIDNVPNATDAWSDDFYAGNFTPAEIAYCLLQETPRLHFAARWCAKEALKKCDSQFIGTDMRNLEVVRNASGGGCYRKYFLNLLRRRH